MQNNPDNPYDEVFGNLSKIVEEIVRNMPESGNARIIGYTIVTRHGSGDPDIFSGGSNVGGDDIPYEVQETEQEIFITATIPAGAEHAPYADIQPNEVRICVDNRSTTVMLNAPIDIIHSTYRVHRGVMDITLRKVPDYK
ncbi:MAG: hypothetical protein LUQ31_05980 [Methanoregula sp.]|nr:hypothetical protein [Methanoregula sp.]